MNNKLIGKDLFKENNFGDEENKDMQRKRSYNPITHKYTAHRLKTTKYGRKGQFKGKWKQPKKRDVQESASPIFYFLGFGIAGGIICSFLLGPIGVIPGFVIGGILGAVYGYYL